MISFDFEYYKPASVKEAVDIFEVLSSQSKKPIFYNGGTEIITSARRNLLFTKAVIDIKDISECIVHEFKNSELYIGAAVTISQIEEKSLFPLLRDGSNSIADQTVRNKITLGGNICGKITYREAVLSLLLCDSEMVIAGKNGLTKHPISEVFDKTLKLANGEFLAQIIINKDYAKLPYVSIRKTKEAKSAYPLVRVLALKKENEIRAAITGVCGFPFRTIELESELNNKSISPEVRVERAIKKLPAPAVNDTLGSDDYRLFVLKNSLMDVLTILEGDSHDNISRSGSARVKHKR